MSEQANVSATETEPVSRRRQRFAARCAELRARLTRTEKRISGLQELAALTLHKVACWHEDAALPSRQVLEAQAELYVSQVRRLEGEAAALREFLGDKETAAVEQAAEQDAKEADGAEPVKACDARGP